MFQRHPTFTGLPYIRLIPKVTAVSGETLHLKCPVAGYPIEEIHWERGRCLCALLLLLLSNIISRLGWHTSIPCGFTHSSAPHHHHT